VAKTVTVEVRDGLATLRLGREHGNAINDALVDDLMAACQQIERDAGVQGLLLAAAGKMFCPGLDLRELIELDRTGMERFLRRFNACVLMLYTFPRPVVAALHGHALAGGCVLSMTADWRVLRRGALIGLNEIQVGVPLPFGVSIILRESLPATHLEEVALFGRNYRDEAALTAGLVHELQDEEDFETRCLERLAELASKDARAFTITKRYLRSATVERIRAHDAQFTGEFLDSWFSGPTQERIRGIVARLTKGA